MTEVELPRRRGLLAHGPRIMAVGSCFADEIGSRLKDALFDITVNPFGALYNPLSILSAFRLMDEAPAVDPSELIFSQGLYHSPDFHSRFSLADAGELAASLSTHLVGLHDRLATLDTVIVTLGSAFAFRYKQTGRIVANCHKLPASDFSVEMIDITQTRDALSAILAILTRYNPSIQIIVTVSPVRHKAYGLHGDRLSKSRLLIGADEFCQAFPDNAIYFPSYEILTDELRDYRFYADDMVHPSPLAVDYIYRNFSDAFFTEDTAALAAQSHRIVQRLRHRPLNPATAPRERAAAIEAATEFARQHPPVAAPVASLLSTLSAND